MAYHIKEIKVPKSCQQFTDEFQEILDDSRNAQVVYIPKFDTVFVVSEVPHTATETDKKGVRIFLRHNVVKDESSEILCERLYSACIRICGDCIDRGWFGRLVFDFFPHVEKKQIRVAGKRCNVYVGIRLKPPSSPDSTLSDFFD